MFAPDTAAAESPNPHATSNPNFRTSAADEVRRMADIIITNQKDGRATNWSDFRAARFTAAQIGAFFPEACEIANRSTFRRVEDELLEDDPDPTLERPLAERMAGAIIKGLQDQLVPIRALQRAGFTGTEIALNLDEANRIVELKLRRAAPPNASLLNLTVALRGMVAAIQGDLA